MTTPNSSATRSLNRIVDSVTAIEGGGFTVFRPFPITELNWVDPFLLLDEMAPTYHEPNSEPVGAPAHPHRGFETVTFVLEGEMEHKDSAGNHGIIGPGDVQWMTAGDGIVHEEMPSERIQREGGLGHGIQLWVNLPAALRRTQPNYQALPASSLAEASGPGWRATVVSGDLFGVTGPAKTHTPVGYARLTAEPGAELQFVVPEGHTAALYIFAGSANLDSQTVGSQKLAIFDTSGGDVAVSVPGDSEAPLDCMVMTGEPIDEPMVRQGPFVMNERSELQEAIIDFQAGRMGTIEATGTV